MRNTSDFIRLTLANGKKPAIIRKALVGLVMELEDTDESGKKVAFTRILPKDYVIAEESNWLDVIESADEIYRALNA